MSNITGVSTLKRDERVDPTGIMSASIKPGTERDPQDYRAEDVYGEAFSRIVVHMAVFGHSANSIAKLTKASVSKVKHALKNPTVVAEIRRIQEEMLRKSAEQVFMRMLPDAVNTTYKLMKSKGSKDSTRLEAAKAIMDRALGKPTQHIEQSTSLIKEVITSLDRSGIRKDAPIEAKFEELSKEGDGVGHGGLAPEAGDLDTLEEMFGDGKARTPEQG